MTKKHDELVEEIASLIKVVAIHRNHEVTQAAEGAAMAILTRILSAVRDGRLDEELGVVGRGRAMFGRAGTIQSGWIEEPLQGPANYQEFNIIALSGTS